MWNRESKHKLQEGSGSLCLSLNFLLYLLKLKQLHQLFKIQRKGQFYSTLLHMLLKTGYHTTVNIELSLQTWQSSKNKEHV